jgi:mono/diheme cytochrome c family protein
MMPRAMLRRLAPVVLAVIACGSLTACGQDNDVAVASNRADNERIKQGSEIFANKCQGCHTLDVVGAEGSAYEVRDRERVDGPNFNVRAETVDNVLYAIRNGGYSGAIMPENIVVGAEADAVAEFLAQYSGGRKQPGTGPGGATNTG